MKIFVNACNIHTGGGKVILNDLIGETYKLKNIEFIFFVDYRYVIPNIDGNNIVYEKISKIFRWKVSHLIETKSCKNDIVIYLTNIPPRRKHKCKTILLQSNRFVIDKYPLKGFSLKTKIRVFMERFLFYLNYKNVDYIVVQSETMRSVLVSSGVKVEKIKIYAYKSKEEQYKIKKQSDNKKCNTNFLYIATDEPHKNHKNLIEAWCILAKIGVFPKLTVTINEETLLHQFINKRVNEYKLNLEILPNLDREKIIKLYSQSRALIFPSFVESYGLPLVEASQYGIPIIASELDYVRDVVDPIESFDPNSAKSISRSVIRFLKMEEKKTEIITPVEFINNIIKL